MAVHRRLRKATKSALSALRGRRVRKPARKARRAAPRGDGPSIDERLGPIAKKALAGEHVECSWELLRLQHFPGWPHERVAAALGLWSTRTGVKVTFEGRTVRDVPVICVCFGR